MKNKELIILISILAILVIVAGGVLIYKVVINKDLKTEETVETATNEQKEETMVVTKKPVQIFQGDSRPIAVMIDNHTGAWPQANLNEAYMVYEIVVEGGETRLMALFKGKDIEKIGPVRSSRHYFLDYALENDAIYVHYGWSPQAQSDISKLKVNNINGITESSSSFWRVKDKSAPHNVLTSTEKILQIAQRKEYATTSTQKSVLNYVADEFDLKEKYPNNANTTENNTTAETTTSNENGAIDALNITIPHSKLQTVKYEYNAETKRYTRYARGKLQKDYVTGEPVTTKNIIITFCDNYDLVDSETKGRQGLSNIGTFDGYYITNGSAIKIKCTKTSRTGQTVYKDLDGNEIEVNDGNTFVNICPINAKVQIKGNE